MITNYFTLAKVIHNYINYKYSQFIKITKIFITFWLPIIQLQFPLSYSLQLIGLYISHIVCREYIYCIYILRYNNYYQKEVHIIF